MNNIAVIIFLILLIIFCNSWICKTIGMVGLISLLAINDKKIGGDQRKKYAYVTLVMLNDNYVSGALVLAYTIRRFCDLSNIDLIVMITHEVSSELLQVVYDKVVKVDYLLFDSSVKGERYEKSYGTFKNKLYTKWKCMEFIEYEKVLFMDCDIAIINELKDVFELPAPAGIFKTCISHPFKKDGVDDEYPIEFGKDIDSQIIKKHLFMGGGGSVASACFILLPTGKELYQNYVDWMVKQTENKPYGFYKCISGHDEQSITQYLTFEKDMKWKNISVNYSWNPWSKSIIEIAGSPKIIHFIHTPKPWNVNEKTIIWDDFNCWFQFYEGMKIHIDKKICTLTTPGNINITNNCFYCKLCNRDSLHNFYDYEKEKICKFLKK